MVLPPEVLAAIKLIAAHSERAEVLAGLQSDAPGLRHEIFQAGHDVGYGKGKTELKVATDKVTELETDKTKLAADLVEARKANPDVAKLHTDYQTQIADQKAAAETELGKVRGQVKVKEAERARTQLQSELEAAGVRRIFAKALVGDPDNVKLLVVGEDGELQVMQPGTAIPFVAAGDKKPLQLLAEKLKSTVPPEGLGSNADGGAGPVAQPTGEAAVVAKIRVDAAAKRESESKGTGSRLGPDGLPKSVSGLAIKSA